MFLTIVTANMCWAFLLHSAAVSLWHEETRTQFSSCCKVNFAQKLSGWCFWSADAFPHGLQPDFHPLVKNLLCQGHTRKEGNIYACTRSGACVFLLTFLEQNLIMAHWTGTESIPSHVLGWRRSQFPKQIANLSHSCGLLPSSWGAGRKWWCQNAKWALKYFKFSLHSLS